MSKSKRKVKNIKFRKGKKCPKCKKGEIQGCSEGGKKGHEHHNTCPVCHNENF
jgi:RNA polymerase subunit RPABC4/transcription elongation factor Spt4